MRRAEERARAYESADALKADLLPKGVTNAVANQGVWEFLDDGGWQAHPPAVAAALSQAVFVGLASVETSFGLTQYRNDLIAMTQTNLTTGYQRRVRCRTWRMEASALPCAVLVENCAVHRRLNGRQGAPEAQPDRGRTEEGSAPSDGSPPAEAMVPRRQRSSRGAALMTALATAPMLRQVWRLRWRRTFRWLRRPPSR